MTLFNHYKC